MASVGDARSPTNSPQCLAEVFEPDCGHRCHYCRVTVIGRPTAAAANRRARGLQYHRRSQAVQAVLIASIGASREARSAGYQPNNIPTSIENSTAETTAQ